MSVGVGDVSRTVRSSHVHPHPHSTVVQIPHPFIQNIGEFVHDIRRMDMFEYHRGVSIARGRGCEQERCLQTVHMTIC